MPSVVVIILNFKLCLVASKPGVCPEKSESDHNIVECSDECVTDENCPAETKCCQSGCSRFCLKPEPQGKFH